MMKSHLAHREKITILVMLLIYLLFMGQEVVLTQVWCHKYDGTRDLEYALFDYYCQCTHSCADKTDQRCSDPSESVVESFPGETSCYNIPAENSRLVRNKCNANNIVHMVIFFVDADSGSADFRFFCNQLFRNIPLSKFIHKPDYPVLISGLRC